MKKLFIIVRSIIAFALFPYVSELVIAKRLPGRIGRYLVIDTLISWSEDNGTV